MTKMSTLTAVLLAVASVVTPLGLYDSISPGTVLEMVPFEYVKDGSVFGIGTLPQPLEGISRMYVLSPKLQQQSFSSH